MIIKGTMSFLSTEPVSRFSRRPDRAVAGILLAAPLETYRSNG